MVLRKLKHFQDMGHTAIFLVGDFTAMVGDPTGQSETRPPLTAEQVHANMQTYLAQVDKILDKTKTEVRYNSEWLGKLTGHDMIRLCAQLSPGAHAGTRRFSLAPCGQSADLGSRTALPALAGVRFGRRSKPTSNWAPRSRNSICWWAAKFSASTASHRRWRMTMPILVGTDGQRKMSKSLGNYIGITEPPSEMFGKIMSISDEMMWPYFDLVTDHTPEEIAALSAKVKSGAMHPMDAKMSLAKEIIAGFHGDAAAEKAAAEFQRVFRDRSAPEDARFKKFRRRTEATHRAPRGVGFGVIAQRR